MDETTVLRYGNTNTFYIRGSRGGLLFDTDYAGRLPAFYRAIKERGIRVGDITYILASHYHPDHMGLIGELMQQGAGLLLMDEQRASVHFSDAIFSRDALKYVPIDESKATVIPCRQSRAFLEGIGIGGEIIHTPSHSPDSVSLILDGGDCLVGDLEPMEYIGAYEDNAALKSDWERIMSHHPETVFFAHRPERAMT